MLPWTKKKAAGNTATARQKMETFLKEVTGKSTAVIPQVCKKLRELNEAHGVEFEVVSIADEYLRHRIVELERNYFHSEEHPEAIASAVTAYCAAFSEAYSTVFSKRGPERPEILSAVRAMRAYTLQCRMFRLGYREPRETTLAAMVKLFTEARASGIVENSLIPYRDEAETSVGNEFALYALFETAPLQNFSQEQIEYFWRVLLLYSGRIPVKSAPGGLVPFPVGENGKTYVKLPAGTNAAYHVGPGLGTFEGISQIASGQKGSKHIWEAGDYLPDVKEEKLVDMANRVLSVWKGEEIRRRSERLVSRTPAPVFVAHGFTLVRKMVAFSACVNAGGTLAAHDAFRLLQLQESLRFEIPITDLTSTSKDVTDPLDVLNLLEYHVGGDSTERWHVTDRSETGIGLLASGKHPWLTVGQIIAIRGSEETDWRVGIVRRVSLKDTARSVGVELLSRSAVAVGVKAFEDLNEKLNWFALHDGILVEGTDCKLIVPPRKTKGEYFVTAGAGKRRHVRLVEKLPDLIEAEAYSCVIEAV